MTTTAARIARREVVSVIEAAWRFTAAVPGVPGVATDDGIIERKKAANVHDPSPGSRLG
jgi:hypothetical protein